MAKPIAASIIIVTGDGAEPLAGILARLRSQTIAEQLEVIFVTRGQHIDAISNLRPNEFADFRVIGGDLTTSARGRAEGVRIATSEIVIFAEDHSFPVTDDWASRIVNRFDEDFAGVGPIVRNANPKTGASWGTLLLEYGPFLGKSLAGPARHIAGHNSAYRKESLLRYGDGLAEMLETEWQMQNDMRSKGLVFMVDPEIMVAHMNYSRIWPSFRLHYLAGRVFAASRRKDWGTAKRAAFTVASPLIFLKRLVDTTSSCLRSDAASNLPRAFSSLICYLAISAAGEAMGYAFGTGGRESELAELEYSRWRHVKPEEADLQTKPAG